MATNPKILLEGLEKAAKAGAKKLATAERTRLGRSWGLAVGSKRPDLLQTAGFLYGRDAAARFNNLGPDQTIAYLDPEDLKSLVGTVPPPGNPGELAPIQIKGELGRDGGITVSGIEGAEGLGTVLAYGEGRKIPVIVPKRGITPPQYASFQGRRINGIRTKNRPETLDELYKNQQGRSIDILRWMMDPANAQDVTIGYAGNGDDFWGDLMSKLGSNEIASQDAFSKAERRFSMEEMKGIRNRQLSDLNAKYRELRDAMGKAEFDKLRGSSKLTPGSMYGDTGEFADMPFLTTRVESHRVGVPEGTRDSVPSWDYSRETGLHSGTLDTAGRFVIKYDRDRYDDALAALKDPQISPTMRQSYEKFVAGYTKNKEKLATGVADAIKAAMPEATLVDQQAVIGAVRKFAEDYAKSPPEFTTTEWFNSVPGKQKLKEFLTTVGFKQPGDIDDMVSSLVDYYSYTSKSTSEQRHYLMSGVNNPLVMHDMSANKPDRIAEYLQGIPEFYQYDEELQEIVEKAGTMPTSRGAGDRSVRTKVNQQLNQKLYDVLKKRGYDSLVYMNQGETVNAGSGLLEPSFILPPKAPVKNASDLAPAYAKANNLKAITAFFAPLVAAIPAKKSEAKGPNPLSPGYYKGDDGKVFYSDGSTLEEVLKK